MTTHTHTAEIHSNTTGSIRAAVTKYRFLYRPSETRGTNPRIPHPGDILYWVGCVSAVSALLFFALR
ncbi:MAG: hypothetical protein NVSMB62_11990 [Acidobacteriaceae bacterium]